MQYRSQDKYFHKAKREGYRARSVYKLQAIQERFGILKPGDKVLDLGAAPGSFLQYLSTIIGPEGLAVGVDLMPIEPFKQKNIITFISDVMESEVLEKKLQEIGVNAFNVIISDMAPSTSGIRFLDSGRSQKLNARTIEIAVKYLVVGGNVVIKLLPGVDESSLIRIMKHSFKTVRHFRPSAVRKTSGEFYLIGLGKIL